MRRDDALLGYLAARLLRAVANTWRVEFRGRDTQITPSLDGGAIGVLWHRDLLLAAGVFRDKRVHAPVSRSRDGDRISAVMAHLGFPKPPRGSSSSGGRSALRALLRRAAAGEPVVIMADGPRGPARKAKHGVVWLSHQSRLPLRPIALSAQWALRFPSWDRLLLPLPFSRVICHFGDPVDIPAVLPRNERAPFAEQVASELDELEDCLDREFGRDVASR